jgi:hypothetical protein
VSSAPYLLILVIGVVIVVVDGQLILRQGPAYLDEVYQDPAHSRQVSALVAVLFHLVMLGITALVASIDLGDDPGPRPIIARAGVLLLLTALGHGATMLLLARMRTQQLNTQVAEAQISRERRRGRISRESRRGRIGIPWAGRPADAAGITADGAADPSARHGGRPPRGRVPYTVGGRRLMNRIRGRVR